MLTHSDLSSLSTRHSRILLWYEIFTVCLSAFKYKTMEKKAESAVKSWRFLFVEEKETLSQVIFVVWCPLRNVHERRHCRNIQVPCDVVRVDCTTSFPVRIGGLERVAAAAAAVDDSRIWCREAPLDDSGKGHSRSFHRYTRRGNSTSISANRFRQHRGVLSFASSLVRIIRGVFQLFFGCHNFTEYIIPN